MKDTILFDLDGTLIDPGLGITRSVAYALGTFGIAVEDLTALYPFIGPPLADSFKKFYGFDAAQANEAVQRYRDYYKVTGIFQHTLYEGVEDMLKTLSAAGKTLLLATSKPAVYAAQILEGHGLDKHFAFIGGSELSGERIHKADVIRYALDSARIGELDSCVMVGDRLYDVEGAAEVGMDCVGVTYGYGQAFELWDATHRVDTVAELTDLLLTL